MSSPFDIIVAGGGVIGSALAIATAQHGFNTALIDANPPRSHRHAEFDGRAFAISLSSHRFLQSIGLKESLDSKLTEVQSIRLSDGEQFREPRDIILQFDKDEIEEGSMSKMVEDRHLREALANRISKLENIRHFPLSRIETITRENGSAHVTLESGGRLTGRILAGCDGRNGIVANLAEIPGTSKKYRQSSIVCAVEHEFPHNGIAHQFFMATGPFAILPLKKNRSSIVWTEIDESAQFLMSLDSDRFLNQLRFRFSDFLGELSLAGKRSLWPLELFVAESMVSERVALVGDSAHSLHPLAGQGMNLGFRDVAALAEVLTVAARRGEDIGDSIVLERYQQWRMFDMVALAAATDGFNLLYSNANEFLRIARATGMVALSGMPWLKRTIIREAAGLTGTPPKLMRGLSI